MGHNPPGGYTEVTRWLPEPDQLKINHYPTHPALCCHSAVSQFPWEPCTRPRTLYLSPLSKTHPSCPCSCTGNQHDCGTTHILAPQQRPHTWRVHMHAQRGKNHCTRVQLCADGIPNRVHEPPTCADHLGIPPTTPVGPKVCTIHIPLFPLHRGGHVWDMNLQREGRSKNKFGSFCCRMIHEGRPLSLGG